MATTSAPPTAGYAGDSPRTVALCAAGGVVSVRVPIAGRTLAERAARLSLHDAMMRCQPGLATTIPEITESPVTTMPMAPTTSISLEGGRRGAPRAGGGLGLRQA